MSIDRNLFKQFLSVYPYQPATAFWRAIEISQVTAKPFPEGFGLDLGCGDGKLTEIVLNRVGRRELVGIDIDPEETEQAKQYDFYARIHTTPGTAIPEADKTFDFAFSNSVLEHIDNVRKVLQETARLLKPGGVFLFTVPGGGFHQSLGGSIFPWIPREQYLAELDVRLAHKRYWSEEDWRRELRHCEMEIETVTPYLTRKEARRWQTIARFTSGFLYGLFSLFGKKRHPIEIQRTLGMRKPDTKLPEPLAGLLAGLLAFNLGRIDGQRRGHTDAS